MKAPGSLASQPSWPEIERQAEDRILRHGDYPRWRTALDSLPDLTPHSVSFSDRIIARGDIPAADRNRLMDALKHLKPWRKGPFELFDVHIDSEWRSDWKWRRIAQAVGSLDGQQVLDVGCGNGYFGWRLLSAGADEVVGVDPSVLFFLQHQAINHYLNRLGRWPNHLLPLAFEALPASQFDLVLSMGVVYHRRDPEEHVERLHRYTRPGGRVLLESLVVEASASLYPSSSGGRYARMRNVTVVPSLDLMSRWLTDAGYVDVTTVDVSPTTTDEQRSTEWMTFESLSEALDPDHPEKTVEGFPAPVRAIVMARKLS